MSRPKPPITDVVDNSVDQTTLDSTAEEVVIRARASNVQAISTNVTQPTEDDPEGGGGKAFVLFPGESIRLPVDRTVGIMTLEVKYIVFNFDSDLALPTIEIMEVIPRISGCHPEA